MFPHRFRTKKEKVQEELQKEIESCDGYTISTYGGDTGGGGKESNAKLGEKKQELSRKIELSLWFGELWGKLNDFEEDKICAANEESKRKEEVGKQLPAIFDEETENSLESGFRAVWEMVGGRSNLLGQPETDTEEKAIENVEI